MARTHRNLRSWVPWICAEHKVRYIPAPIQINAVGACVWGPRGKRRAKKQASKKRRREERAITVECAA